MQSNRTSIVASVTKRSQWILLTQGAPRFIDLGLIEVLNKTVDDEAMTIADDDGC
jgi:hypothetical protein